MSRGRNCSWCRFQMSPQASYGMAQFMFNVSQLFRPDSSEKWWYNNKNTVQYLIYTVWHLATPFLVFFFFLDSTIRGHVTHISDFLRYRKIKITDFSQSYDHYKILCKLASGHALTCLSPTWTSKFGDWLFLQWFLESIWLLRQNYAQKLLGLV